VAGCARKGLKMQISELQLVNLSFELRYDQAFHLYDRSGVIWSTFQKRWPKLTQVVVSPNNTKFVINDTIELTMQIDKCSVGCSANEIDLDVFCEASDLITGLTKSALEVNKFSRIGLRQIFLKSYKSEDEALQEFSGLNRVTIPKGKHFEVEGVVKSPEVSVRVEGDALGWYGRILVQNKRIKFQGPAGEPDIPQVDINKFEFAFDLDYYTTATTSAGQLKAADWIKQGIRVVRRDARVLLEPAK
jgi:hypothetical protein